MKLLGMQVFFHVWVYARNMRLCFTQYDTHESRSTLSHAHAETHTLFCHYKEESKQTIPPTPPPTPQVFPLQDITVCKDLF